MPNAFQEEAGRPAEGDQPSSTDLAWEDTSNDAAIRQERRAEDDDANDSPRDTILAPPLALNAARFAEEVAQRLQSKGSNPGKTGQARAAAAAVAPGARRQAPWAASQSLTGRRD
ncbi:MAG: hypothetical protein VKO39_01870 [Cyanobacteriota bacterium]|nr:hypothetical protein [Cyanobacteriota bacterium]